MPANLPPDYHRAEERYRAAKTTEDKIGCLEEMLRIMPKHKGTDGLQAQLRARISKLRKQPEKKGARASFGYNIAREGAGQVALVGPANTGKSSLVALLTNATPEIAAYPFTTREPTPGMMPFEDIGIQLVDLPPLSEEHVEPWVFDFVRRADLLWIVLDAVNPIDELEVALRVLDGRNLGARPVGTNPTGEDRAGRVSKKALLVVTGLDKAGASEAMEILDEWLERRWPVAAVSCATGAGLEDLRRRTFEALDVIRVYTKQPGKPPDRTAPFTLDRGATVGDLALRIHKDLREAMKFARLWRPGVFDGQTVQRNHVLAEGDVVEIHA
jgi:hypothetical protein